MIKNIILDIRIIFNIYLKILKTYLIHFNFQTNFYLQNIISQKLFFKTILKNSYQISLKILIEHSYSNELERS